MNFKIDFAKREDIRKMEELDYIAFGQEVASQVEMSVEMIEGWYDINKYQWLVAKDEDENVLGWIGIYHLNEKAFKKLESREMLEIDLTNDDFVEFKKDNTIYCHIVGFTVRNKNTRVAISLINKCIAYFRFLKDNNIRIKGISSMAVTDQGIKLCRKLGFIKAQEYDMLPNEVRPKLFVLNLADDNFSMVVNAIKHIFLENDKYL